MPYQRSMKEITQCFQNEFGDKIISIEQDQKQWKIVIKSDNKKAKELKDSIGKCMRTCRYSGLITLQKALIVDTQKNATHTITTLILPIGKIIPKPTISLATVTHGVSAWASTFISRIKTQLTPPKPLDDDLLEAPSSPRPPALIPIAIPVQPPVATKPPVSPKPPEVTPPVITPLPDKPKRYTPKIIPSSSTPLPPTLPESPNLTRLFPDLHEAPAPTAPPPPLFNPLNAIEIILKKIQSVMCSDTYLSSWNHEVSYHFFGGGKGITQLRNGVRTTIKVPTGVQSMIDILATPSITPAEKLDRLIKAATTAAEKRFMGCFSAFGRSSATQNFYDTMAQLGQHIPALHTEETLNNILNTIDSSVTELTLKAMSPP